MSPDTGYDPDFDDRIEQERRTRTTPTTPSAKARRIAEDRCDHDGGYKNCEYCQATERLITQAVQAERTLLDEAKTFIEYARYELEPGLAGPGSQFPHQEDADRIIAKLSAALLARRPAPEAK